MPAAKHTEGAHETKFVLPNHRAHIFLAWLNHRCLTDPNYPVGIVSSIYYDTKNWRFLNEKINSDYLKTKVRLRWYADIDTGTPEDVSFLEAKFKIGSTRKKVRLKTDLSGKWLSQVALNDKRLPAVPEMLRTEGIILPPLMLPVFKIAYKRRRFIEPVTGARLSLDYDIYAPDVNFQAMPRTDTFKLKNAVFELKGKFTELPNSITQLTALGCRKDSFSKYSACYQKIMQIFF